MWLKIGFTALMGNLFSPGVEMAGRKKSSVEVTGWAFLFFRCEIHPAV